MWKYKKTLINVDHFSKFFCTKTIQRRRKWLPMKSKNRLILRKKHLTKYETYWPQMSWYWNTNLKNETSFLRLRLDLILKKDKKIYFLMLQPPFAMNFHIYTCILKESFVKELKNRNSLATWVKSTAQVRACGHGIHQCLQGIKRRIQNDTDSYNSKILDDNINRCSFMSLNQSPVVEYILYETLEIW